MHSTFSCSHSHANVDRNGFPSPHLPFSLQIPFPFASPPCLQFQDARVVMNRGEKRSRVYVSMFRLSFYNYSRELSTKLSPPNRVGRRGADRRFWIHSTELRSYRIMIL